MVDISKSNYKLVSSLKKIKWYCVLFYNTAQLLNPYLDDTPHVYLERYQVAQSLMTN